MGIPQPSRHTLKSDCPDPICSDEPDEAAIDRWNDGALDGCRGVRPRSNDADYLSGHAHGSDERKVRVVLPVRPEGYYHLPVGTFD